MAEGDPAKDKEHRAISRPAALARGCIIVGVGASAGGLEAFQRFLRHMPLHARIALVYVQHLDPSHESFLPELLAREARIPVQAVQDETRVEPGRVYVIPPNASLTLHGGVLRLGPRRAEGDSGKPIDGFLLSLAEDQGDRAVGVILSGTGTDGTAGLRAIMEQGGVTIAQLPESAAFDSMPRSAVAAGVVDYVLRPDEMPARLVEQASQLENPAAGQREGMSSAVEDAITGICDIVRRRTGYDFSSYKRSTLARRIGRRMDALQIASPAEYLERLQQDDSEAGQLSQEMLIGVTAFFRDHEAFDVVAERVLPTLLEGKGATDHVRAWVVGCASGEEVYSLAILLAEDMARRGATPKVQIFATDIDNEALQVARKGRYPWSVCSQLSPDRLERFFTREEGDCQVRKELRQMCVFSKHNVLHDPPFPELDLISCRNLLIYIDSRIQGKLMSVFHHALRSGGTLFLGAAENIAGRADLFEPVERGQRIYRRRDLTVREPMEFPLTSGPTRDRFGVPGTTTFPVGPEAALRRTLERAVLDEYTPPGMVVREDGEIVYLFGPTANYLGPSAGAPSLNAFALLRKNLRTDLRRALQKAAHSGARVVVEGELAADPESPAERINLIARPFIEVDPDRHLYVVVFQDLPAIAAENAQTLPAAEETDVRHLRGELRDTREQLQATIDALEVANQELQSANEELLSMNEELQSANEELQSSKEEVQTINSELEAVNRELVHKVEELDTAKSDLESLFEGAQVATVFVDNHLLIKRFTPSATEVFRLRAVDVGRPVTDITARFIDDVEGKIREALRTLQRQEVTVSRADDGRRYLMRILPYRTRQNVIDGVVITFVDVTELQRAREALQRANDELERRVAERTAALEAANRRKDDFLAMLSHELRNPLAAIASSVDLWHGEELTDPRLVRARELAERQVGHMKRLLDDLLDTARIVRGSIELRREGLDLGRVIRTLVDGARAQAAARNQEILVSLPRDPLPVEGDWDRLLQVFGNLLNNAQKYTPPGGHITLSAEVTQAEHVVRVSDDGFGIPAALLPRVFDFFVQGHRGPDRSQGGLGLGLTLVRELVTLHGGSVEARSAGEGKGSEFVVRLPRGSAAPNTTTSPPAAKTDATPTGPSRKRILVVDDNPDAAELLSVLLKMEGHEVMTVRDGPSTLQAATDFRPNVVLLDLGLPGMDGYEVARRLRQNAAIAGAALVAITGYGGDEDRRRSREAGIDHHLVKPVDIVAIKRLLDGIA